MLRGWVEQVGEVKGRKREPGGGGKGEKDRGGGAVRERGEDADSAENRTD